MPKKESKAIEPEVVKDSNLAQCARFEGKDSKVTQCVTFGGRGRKPNILRLIPECSMPERIVKISEYHNLAYVSLAQGAFYALMCGFELHAARAGLAHGQWQEWVVENCPFSYRTARRYMEAAERKHKDIPKLADIKDFAVGISPASLNEEQRKKLITSVKNATDNESMRQMYLDLGIIKADPKSRGGDHGGGAARAEQLKNLTPLELEKFNSDEQWFKLETGLREFAMQKRRYVHVDREKLIAGIESIKDCIKGISDFLKQ